jgi:hypothetical protein
MKGLCFNSLTQDHKVASCRDPIRCWCYHGFGHTSTECHPSSSVQPPNTRFCLNLGDVLAPPHIARDVGVVIDDNLLFGYNTSSATYERRSDLMLLKALLVNQRCDIEGGSSTPPSTDLTMQVAIHHTSMEDISTPVLRRNEAEQLAGQELIKTLSNYKQLTVRPLSPHTQ